MPKCECGNDANESGQCDWCEYEASQEPHTGHYSRLGGVWWCDTCNSPYCDLL